MLPSNTLKHSGALRAGALLAALTLLLSGCGAGTDVQTQNVGTRTVETAQYAGAETHHTSSENLVFVTSSGLVELYYDSATDSAAVRETNTGTMWQTLPAARTDGAEVQSAVVTAEVSNGGTVYTLNSQDNAVAFGTSAFQPTQNGMELTYNMALDAETAARNVADVPAGAPYVSVTVAFTLEDGALRVSVHCSDILVSTGFVLERLTLLDWFGATDSAAEGDYMLLPDGSGAIETITGTSSDAYTEKTFVTYGADAALGEQAETADGSIAFTSALLPVYGMKRGESAFVAIIESGDAISRITSHRAAGDVLYNRVGATFCVTDTALLGGEGDQTLYTGNAYTGELGICYRFLSNRNAGYSGMAAACREVLIRNGVLPSQAASVPETLPLLLTAYGAAAKNNPNRSETLTDYMQMQELLRLLKAKSVDNVLLRMSGALDGATSQGLLKSSDLSGKLGSEKELEALLQYAQTQQFSVYLNVDIASFGRRSARKSAHAAENIAGDTLSMAVNNPFTGVAGDAQHTRYLLRQTEIGENVDAFVNDFHSLAFSGYCIDDAGSTLYSDYASAGNTRTVAAGLMQEQAATLAAGRTLMVDTGNAYLLRDADIVVDLPSAAVYPETDGYTSVPFVQMVLHGLVAYAHEPINLAENSETAFLKALEYGAMPSYAWDYTKTGDETIDTVYHYESQINTAAANYLTAAQTLGDLQDARMTAHYEVQDGVYCTEYNNSTTLYFNYTDEAVTVNSITVEPMSCQRVN